MEDGPLKIIGPAYEVDVEYVKKTLNVVYNQDDIRRDLKDQFEDDFLQQSGRKELSREQQYIVLDKVENLIDFVNLFDHNKNTKGRKVSISNSNKPTNLPSNQCNN